MRVPVEVWHVKNDVMERLKAENTDEAERLMKELKRKELISYLLFSVNLGAFAV